MILVNINESLHNWDGTERIEVGNHEAWNFKPIKGHYYGAFPEGGHTNLVRLGGGTKAVFVNDVTVVWVVKKKTVVGWYLNATVFATGQDPPPATGTGPPVWSGTVMYSKRRIGRSTLRRKVPASDGILAATLTPSKIGNL